jgi:hypothetical protein
MPAILCLQLKRYEYNRQTGAAIILNHVVTYREREFFEGVEYELQAVVFHAGDSAHAGHYWTIAGHGVESAKKWWKYNDSARQEAAVGELLESWTLAGRGKPYLLLYEKVDSQRRLPSLSQASAEKHGAPGSVPLDLSNIMSLESSCQEAVAQEGHNAAGDTKSISTLTESQIIAAATLEVVAGCTGFSRMWQEHNARCGYPKMTIADIVKLTAKFAREACGESMLPETELPCPRGCPATFGPAPGTEPASTGIKEDSRRKVRRDMHPKLAQVPEGTVPMITEADGTEPRAESELHIECEEIICDVVDVNSKGKHGSQSGANSVQGSLEGCRAIDVLSDVGGDRETEGLAQKREGSPEKTAAKRVFDDTSTIADVDWHAYLSSLESRLTSMQLRFVLAPLATCAGDNRLASAGKSLSNACGRWRPKHRVRKSTARRCSLRRPFCAAA